MVHWGAKEFVVGKPTSRISWDSETYLGETEEVESYTSDWFEAEETEDVRIYFVNPFEQITEEAMEFSIPVQEYPEVGKKPDPKATSSKIGPKDRSLGEANVELIVEWIRKHVEDGLLPPVNIDLDNPGKPWADIWIHIEEEGPELVKNVINSMDYDTVKVEPRKSFYLGTTMCPEERQEYVALLKEYIDVFAWKASDLQGIKGGLEEHRIDLMEGTIPVRQR